VQPLLVAAVAMSSWEELEEPRPAHIIHTVVEVRALAGTLA
jgi:hypothetical protein